MTQVVKSSWRAGCLLFFLYFHAHASQLSPIFSFVKLHVSLEYILGLSRPPNLEPGYGAVFRLKFRSIDVVKGV